MVNIIKFTSFFTFFNFLYTTFEARKLQGIRLALCQLECLTAEFNCNCEMDDWILLKNDCIPRSWQCDGWNDCADGSDEIDCRCAENEFQCGCDNGTSCLSDVIYECVHPAYGQCMSEKQLSTFCRYSSEQCNGIIECPWEQDHDESNCSSCPSDKPNRCNCNKESDIECKKKGGVCYSSQGKCDGIPECSDYSDELGCYCGSDRFMCQCYKTLPPKCFYKTGCIRADQFDDGVLDCPDGSDETPFKNEVSCESCNVTIWRFDNETSCENMGNCDSTTCFRTFSIYCANTYCETYDVICTSHCYKKTAESCDEGFQCSDGSLILASQFCDNRFDCPDNSDELRHVLGFKCINRVGTCVLPQRNLYDDVAHCEDESDLCFDGLHKCYQCLDKKYIIASSQICDGILDCQDMSDECLCSNATYMNPECVLLSSNYSATFLPLALKTIRGTLLTNPDSQYLPSGFLNVKHSTTQCLTKWGLRTALICDGRPECKDFSDECNCTNPPEFCNDSCRLFYPLGDRYCDGFEDIAWKYINDSNCPKGFDEIHCPKRFYCSSGRRVNIDLKELCNGEENCDDGRDEINCSYVFQLQQQNISFPSESSHPRSSTYIYLSLLYIVLSYIVV